MVFCYIINTEGVLITKITGQNLHQNIHYLDIFMTRNNSFKDRIFVL